jgi:formylglycine-generating enzyme required for sulfatase activity/cytochrome c553
MSSRFSLVLGLVISVMTASVCPAKPPAEAPPKGAKSTAEAPAKPNPVAKAGQKVAVKLGTWQMIGPFVPKQDRGFAQAFAPEQEIDLSKSYDGLRWEARLEFVDGVVHSLEVPGNGSVYLYRTITAAAATTSTGYFGSDDGLVVWLNGKKVISKDVPRVADVNQDTAVLELQPGQNQLLMKVYNISGGSGFYFSISPKPSKSAGGANRAEAVLTVNIEAVRLAITDLIETFGQRYAKGPEYLKRLEALEKDLSQATEAQAGKAPGAAEKLASVTKDLTALRDEALLANPLLGFGKMLVVKRNPKKLGLPQNWQGNSTIGPTGYDNEIDILTIAGAAGEMKTLYRPTKDEFVGDLEIHWDGDRFLLSKPGTHGRFQVFEMKTDGTGLRQVTPGDQSDVDNYDACYLPDGRIIFCSTACFLGVPCVGGADYVGSLYLLDEKTKAIRQLTYDQDHSWCPTVLNNGRVLYTRWEYSDTPHYFCRLLFEMNPDGTAQFEYYGSNSYWPNSIFYARPIPGDASKVAAVISGHHGVARMGELVIFDSSKGRQDGQGAVRRIPGYGRPVEPVIADGLVNNSWPKFLHPYPLSDKYFIVSCQPKSSQPWGIYLVDVFDNFVCLREEPGWALLEPTPIRQTPRPPVIPDKVKLDSNEATVYMVDVYRGGGLKEVPRGTVKALRVYTNQYGYRGMGGHVNIGVDGPWDAKRILGTIPVNEDGSAMFKVPANVPIVVQPIDAQGKALQVMRSWYTAMPGEFASCVGCHERQSDSPAIGVQTMAFRKPPTPIQPWYGPARPFSFDREVQQPVLQKHCVGCHNGQARADGRKIPDYRGRQEAVGNRLGGFDPAYLALHRFVRRPGNESDHYMLIPTEFEADTSELVQMLKKGHHNVQLDAEAWDRLYTWIDLNVPCHGTWNDHNGRAIKPAQRKVELARLYGGADYDPEVYPEMPALKLKPIVPPPEAPVAPQKVDCPGWPFEPMEAKRRQEAGGPATRSIDLGQVLKLELVRMPAGEFVMGDLNGAADERPLTRARIDKPFWMGKLEITNEQYALFDPEHDSGVISMHNKDHDTRGYPANKPKMPVIRISWQQATAFCRWLSVQTGEKFTLPTEAQWEYACRAGSAAPFFYGDANTDFSPFANLGDYNLRALAVQGLPPRPSPNPNPMLDWVPKDERFNDNSVLMADVGSYRPNAWGLHDMHGNVAEWTRTTFAPYPYKSDDGRDSGSPDGPKVVRGGSWFDRPMRCRSAFRLSYPSWRGVYNVGFRVISEGRPEVARTAAP